MIKDSGYMRLIPEGKPDERPSANKVNKNDI